MSTPSGRPPSLYRLAPAVAMRLTGVALVLTGVAVVLLAVLVVLDVLPVLALSVGVVAALVIVLATGLLLLRGPAVVVRLDEAGYQVHLVRGAGVKQGSWRDVEDAAATTVAGERCVVLRRKDGTATTIPVGFLAGSSDDFVRDLQQRLNRGHGYRPVS